MKYDRLRALGQRIREIRETRKLTLREVSLQAGISTGLLSKVENFRTMPSIPVLAQIANALDVEITELFIGVRTSEKVPFHLVRNGEGEADSRPDSEGLSYSLLVADTLQQGALRVNVVSVEPGTCRKPIGTDAQEVVYVLNGNIRYGVGNHMVDLNPGDTLYFDGRIPHSVENVGESSASMLKVYIYHIGVD